jgi:hypothetical protein
LEEIGVIIYDTDQRSVKLTEAASKQDFYVSDLSERRAPWGAYYPLFTGISTVVLIGTWFDVYPLTIPSPWLVVVFFVVSFVALTRIHLYHN